MFLATLADTSLWQSGISYIEIPLCVGTESFFHLTQIFKERSDWHGFLEET